MGADDKEPIARILNRRYLSRLISYREAKKNARAALNRGDHREAARYREEASGHNSACAEIHKIARDAGIALDTAGIREKARAFEQEAEVVTSVFKEDFA